MTIQELEQCIMRYGTDIYSFCMHLTNKKERADDLYQDTFLEATRKLKAIRYEDNPKSYLLSIAIRLWKNRVRKQAWRNRIAPQTNGQTVPELTEDGQPNMMEKVVMAEEKCMLWSAIDRLNDSYRIPILLYYMENQSIADIARLINIPQGTVKSRLHKARKLLEKDLEDYFL